MTSAQLTGALPEDFAPGARVAGVRGELPGLGEAGKVAPRDARELSKVFFDRLQLLEEGTPEHQYVRNSLIEMNLSLVKFVVRRFRNRGDGEMEDISQVGMIGLIKAIDRFDLTRGVVFSSFAIPYIEGEIKRFFRDSTWAVHVPRRLQELRTELAKAKESLSNELDRDPTMRELADHLNLSDEEVREGLIAANAYITDPLDAPEPGGEESPEPKRTHADTAGELDPAMELFENLHTLAPLLRELNDRERKIIEMRFGQEFTQVRIGEELGISQMHVSRLLARALAQLRAGLLTG
ncbi:SigB/SigF/SigG family RNA polymerase sigma factor [Streptomyces sp. AM8-1-1]|uniref:SigB/SigF/SigG family RNA polymerase sigma factor n=1 Tax=Streptomyces sp. AM8-1-1 TaxID=3075825 RepID=UPI0028C3C8F9|nr:SigB/SigF/SigG family RNA polymerase sigma factor [Streptomyces sp. AM8-1-1]WNO77002.1 SigB/SigF/SigG family RNA polymerase sigma factor [Streptomyces sp. AM8-1-1]